MLQPYSLPDFVCSLAPYIDVALDWFMGQPFLANLVGASIVGEHWMGLEEQPRSEIGFVYVVNNADERRKLRERGISIMTDCIDNSS